MNKRWRRVYQDFIVNDQVYVTYNTKQTFDGGFAMIGFGRDPNATVSSQDVWLIKVDSLGCLANNCISLGYAEEFQNPPYFYVYPNPSNRYIQLKTNTEITYLELFDLMGKKVISFNYSQGQEIDLALIPQGLYVLKAQDRDGNTYTEKIVLH